MGFKDVDWALNRNAERRVLEFTDAAVLVVIAHHTDDKDHSTIVGMQTIADELGANVKTIQRSVRVLSDLGIVLRERRRANGYRTTDKLTIDRTWVPQSLGTESQGTKSRETVSPDLPDSESPAEGLKVGAEEITQDHSVDHPDTHTAIELYLVETRTFSDFWGVWPRSESKKAAEAAWNRAVKREDREVIYQAAVAYASSPNLPMKKFIPHASTWLNGDRWNDPLPEAPERERRLSNADASLAYLNQLAAQQNTDPKGIAS